VCFAGNGDRAFACLAVEQQNKQRQQLKANYARRTAQNRPHIKDHHAVIVQ